MKFSIVGKGGFIANHLASYLSGRGHDVHLLGREDAPDESRSMGHVIFAIGLTGDFRHRPFDTVEAHVCELNKWLRSSRYDSWLYLSSTRVLGTRHDGVATEDSWLETKPQADTLYDLTKLTGEALCMSLNNRAVRVARLANVYGRGMSKHTFLGSVLDRLSRTGNCTIAESPTSGKDYVAIQDVVQLIESISAYGLEQVYNVASGVRISHIELAAALQKTGPFLLSFETDAPTRVFPNISVVRVCKEFEFVPRSLIRELPNLL